MTSRHVHLMQEIQQLVQALHTRSTTDVDAVVSDLTARALRSVPGAQHVGITLVNRGDVRTVAATSKHAEMLDEIQQRHDEGPCLPSEHDRSVVRIDDTTLESRWPAYCRDVVELTPIRSVLSFELFTQLKTIAALTIAAERPHAFDDEAVELGLIYATGTTLAWDAARRREHFRRALASRDVIGQAKGIIMQRFKIDDSRAFALLKQLSQTSNTPVSVVARQLVESG